MLLVSLLVKKEKREGYSVKTDRRKYGYNDKIIKDAFRIATLHLKKFVKYNQKIIRRINNM